MQSETERALRNLTILGSISHNDKINTNEETFSIYVPTALRGLVRTWYSEKRCSNSQKIQDTVRAGIAFVQNTSQELLVETTETYSKANKQKQCVRIFHSLEKSKIGLNNLQQTYRDDTTMHTQLQIIMDEIDDFVSIVSQQSQMHFLLLSSSPTVVPASSPISGLTALQLPHAHVSSPTNSDSTERR
tara:strand:- start:538 stop:1101 length:564 start_codon:yes stop_codon:yes gene_type:complete